MFTVNILKQGLPPLPPLRMTDIYDNISTTGALLVHTARLLFRIPHAGAAWGAHA